MSVLVPVEQVPFRTTPTGGVSRGNYYLPLPPSDVRPTGRKSITYLPLVGLVYLVLCLPIGIYCAKHCLNPHQPEGWWTYSRQIQRSRRGVCAGHTRSRRITLSRGQKARDESGGVGIIGEEWWH